MYRKLFIALLLLLHFTLLVIVQHEKSPTYDEAFYAAYGYSLWRTGDYRMGLDKPPLVPLLDTIPLLFLDLKSPASDEARWDDVALWTGQQARDKNELNKVLDTRWNLSLNFLFDNMLDADRIIARARFPAALLSCLFALGMYFAGQALWGATGGLTALVLYVFCPNILANASVATEDSAVAGFFFFAVFFFYQALRSPRRLWALLTGACTGLALASKFTALLLFPAFLLMALFLRPAVSKALLYRTGLALLACVFTVGLFYKFFDLNYFFYGIHNLQLLQDIGQQTFLMGKFSDRGFWNYYLVALLVKTPLPLLLLLGTALFSLIRKKTSAESRRKLLFFLIPVLVVLVAASLSKKQIGLRYILPAYPFLFLIAAGQKKMTPWVFALLAWFAVSSTRVFPHYMAYFNEFSGGPGKGHHILADSNVDWGQDLKGLREYVLASGSPDVILSYYGACLPGYVGFDFQDLFSFGIWGKKDSLNPDRPERELLAVSATNLDGVYFGPVGHDLLSWLSKKQPLHTIGHSLFLYDITNDADAHRRLAHIYFFTGQYEKAARETRRALLLDPADRHSRLIAAALRLQGNNVDAALGEYRALLRLDPMLRLPYAEFITTARALEAYTNAFVALGYASASRNFSPGAEAAFYWARAFSPDAANVRELGELISSPH